MNSLLRYGAIFVGALLSLLLILTLAVVLFVDPNDYRDDILNALSEETGREFSMDGDIELGAFPCCSLRLNSVSAGNPTAWQEQRWRESDFMRVASADLSVQLWPLLTRGELRIGQVTLDGLSVNLISRKDGSVNWEFTAAGDDSPNDVRDEEPGAPAAALNIDGIVVRDAEVSYSDLAAGDSIRLTELDFSAGRIVFGEPADISVSLLAAGLLPEQPVRLELEAAAVISADGNQAELRDLAMQLDATRITGWVKLLDLQSEQLAFELKVDRLDADAYLAAESGAEDTNAAASNINDERIDVPADTLRTLNVNGNINIAELIFEGAQLADVNVTVASGGGALRLHPLTATLYGGSYAGDVRLDVRGSKPKLAVDGKLTGITLAELLADTADMENLAGFGNLRITANGRGDTVGELLKSLSGDAAFELQQGMYRGVDLWYEVRKAQALIKQTEPPPRPDNPRTELSEFSGTLKFADGQASNQDFKATLPFMRLTGAGNINLVDAVMDYRLQARVVDTPGLVDSPDVDSPAADESADTADTVSQLKGLTIPINVKGPIDDPKVGVDLGDLLKDTVTEKARERLEDKIKKKLKLFD